MARMTRGATAVKPGPTSKKPTAPSPTKGKATAKTTPPSSPTKKGPSTRSSPRKGDSAPAKPTKQKEEVKKKPGPPPKAKSKQESAPKQPQRQESSTSSSEDEQVPTSKSQSLPNHSPQPQTSVPTSKEKEKSSSRSVSPRKDHTSNSDVSLKEERTSVSPVKQQQQQEEDNKSKSKKTLIPGGSKASTTTAEKDAEQLKKRKDAEMKLGGKILSKMPEEDIQQFLDILRTHCTPFDTKSHFSRFSLMKWDKLAFGNYSGDQLRAVWRFLRTSTRTFRIMSEVVEEILVMYDRSPFKTKLLETLPGFPPGKRTSSAFSRYMKEKWDTRTEEERRKYPTYLLFQVVTKPAFDAMSEEERKQWEPASKSSREDYDAQVQAYFEEHPEYAGFKKIYERLKAEEQNPSLKKKKNKKSTAGYKPPKQLKEKKVKMTKEEMDAEYPDAPEFPLNPQGLFINSRLKKLDPEEVEHNLAELKQRYSEKWNKLSDKKKAKWINKCINKCEEYRLAIEEYKATHPGYHPAPFKLVQRVSRPDFQIWETVKGRPVRPPFTVNELFQTQLREKDKYKNLTPTQLKEVADSKFNEMSTNDKELYRVHFKQMMLMYRRDIGEFYNSAPDVAKPMIYTTIPKKFRDGLVLPNISGSGDEKPEPSEHEENNNGEGREFTPPRLSLISLSPPPSLPSISSRPLQSEPSPSKKKYLSAKYVEDSDSSTDNNPVTTKKRKLDKIPLPEIVESPKKSMMKAEERSPSPVKKKKKKHTHADASEESESVHEYVIGIESHLSKIKPQPKPKTTPQAAEVVEPKKKKHTKPAQEDEEEIQVTYHSKHKHNEYDDDEDEESDDDDQEEEKGHGHGSHGSLPSFPNRYHRSSSSSSSSDEESSELKKTKGTTTMQAPQRTSKEYRDLQIEKFQQKKFQGR